MRDFHELKVWQKAHRFALDLYRATQDFPAEERFGLTTQLRRAAASVASNIAEGCGREGERDFARLLSIAGGSAKRGRVSAPACARPRVPLRRGPSPTRCSDQRGQAHAQKLHQDSELIANS